MPKGKSTIRLARDTEADDGMYVISVGEELSVKFGLGWASFKCQTLCPDKFEQVAPQSCHLKPGEGPIKIDIKITKVKRNAKK